jgi:hypothetical protein
MFAARVEPSAIMPARAPITNNLENLFLGAALLPAGSKLKEFTGQEYASRQKARIGRTYLTESL